jgi:glycosyltransferase involved in cell wall biosynthesis
VNRVILSVVNDLVSDQRVHRIAVTLHNAGAEITLVGRKLDHSPSLSKRPYRTLRFRLPFNKGFLFYATYNIRLFLFLLFARVDILVANDLDTLPANYLVSLLRKKKLVFDSHEYFTEVPELIHRSFVRSVWKKIESMIVPRIVYASTVNLNIANEYYQAYGTRFTVIRNLPFFRPVIADGACPFPRTGRKIILYQGALNAGRGLELMIMSMKQIDNAELIILGDGDIAADLRLLAERLKVIDRLTFAGRVPLEKVASYTDYADLGISLEEDLCLNYRYALPNKLFDYIQAHVPVLVSDLPVMAEVVEKYKVGAVLRNRDPGTLALLVNKMLLDEALKAEWRFRLALAAVEFCWEKEEPSLLAFYKQAGLNVSPSGRIEKQ